MNSQQKIYLAGIDGIRAIAVLGVLIYHLDIAWLFPGGFLGVDIFFSVSGFLITSLILKEFEEKRTFSFKNFFIRRARRLFPAVVGMLLILWLICLLYVEEALPIFQQDVYAAILYASNWWQIYSNKSYFELTGRPSLLLHLWSLAIEEQFYIVWPPTLVFIYCRWGKTVAAATAAIAAITVAVWMAVLANRNGYPLEADPSRAYFGTDTHTMGLFIGAFLGIVWSPWHPQNSRVVVSQAHSLRLINVLGYGFVALLLFIMLTVDETSENLYQGGFFLVSLIAAGLVVIVSHEQLSIAKYLGSPWLRWLGSRSYSLYLWHWPIFSLLRPGFELTDNIWQASLIRITLSMVVAEISYRYIEQPFRNHQTETATRQVKYTYVTAITLVVVLVAPSILGVQVRNEIQGSHTNQVVATKIAPSLPASVAQLPPSKHDTVLLSCNLEQVSSLKPPTDQFTLIGDSVLLGVQAYLAQHMANVQIDAKVGRQGREGLDVIQKLKVSGQLADNVLIHLGTNGYLSEKHLKAMLEELKGKKVIFVNTRAARRWVEPNNLLLLKLSTEFKEMKVLDWHVISDAHEEFFVADGVHLTQTGIRQYATSVSNILGAPLYMDACFKNPRRKVGVPKHTQKMLAETNKPSDNLPSPVESYVLASSTKASEEIGSVVGEDLHVSTQNPMPKHEVHALISTPMKKDASASN